MAYFSLTDFNMHQTSGFCRESGYAYMREYNLDEAPRDLSDDDLLVSGFDVVLRRKR